MGKNLKGRECGKGIYQRKDGKYSARFCTRNWSCQEKYFDTLPEARNWLADAKNSSYDTHLYKLCDEAGIKRFCMHCLRHTYATRCIEAGMQPKTLQKLLGHASLKTTMDRYVHVTDDSLENGMKLFEQGQRANGLSAEREENSVA